MTKAALRRAWVADPAIRDFIGMAENQWDFTDPNAMFGFGPLRSTDNVAELVAHATGNIKSVVLTEDNVSMAAVSPQTADAEDPLTASSKQPADSGSEKTEPRAVSEPDKSGLEDDRQPDAAVQNTTRTAERQPLPTRRSGGGALPE